MAVWYMPEEDELYWLSAGSTEKISNLHHLKTSVASGFVFYPFNNQATTPVFLSSPKYFQGFNQMSETFKINSENNFTLPEKPAHLQSTLGTEYLEALKLILQKIRSGEAQKVVLSKIKIVERQKKSPAELFLKLKEKYPGAYCWMFYTPETGLWTGASPEILLTHSEGKFTTVALAGSRKAGIVNNQPWPEKERREQQFVTDYITSALKNIGVKDLTVSEPFNYIAGNIEHIRTDIFFKTGGVSTDAILSALHPTPAVGGFPKTEALKIINEYEPHQRDYYTGFLGTMNMSGTSHLFVNLRCMKIWENHYQLFTGGGITAQSDPHAEWEETELKTQTLLAVIEDE